MPQALGCDSQQSRPLERSCTFGPTSLGIQFHRQSSLTQTGAITLIEQLDSARLPFDASTTESIGLALCLRTAPHHKSSPGCFTLVERLPGAQAAVGRQESSQMTNKSEGAAPCRSRSHSILGRAMAPQVKAVVYPVPLGAHRVEPRTWFGYAFAV